MKPITTTIACALLLSGLAACKEEEKQPVAFFVENPAERSQRLATCELQDRSSDDANCANAREAERQAASQRDAEGFQSTFGKPSF
ncbi:EexN family lipoprotein [Cereibacter sphaeroides]|uniref:EexN family lipoprotein n=1 Tax=Cereibacter sphaeroides TaxID=1063 RepID=UPI001F25062E|nr:EexN family lipoprotein [Cereibacter sphaeroides]MCE6967529.1 EexN family lipoprotein [Cereibacter sphaeroides]